MSGYTIIIGMLVCCVDDCFSVEQRSFLQTMPRRGMIYRVRGLIELAPGCGLLLAEIKNAKIGVTLADGTARIDEPYFRQDRFVPVDPHALDIFREEITVE